MTLLTKASCAALVFVIAGCSIITGNDDDDDLRAAERRWNRANVQDYQAVVQYLCFCGYTRPVRLTVRSGNVVSRVDAETGQPVPAEGNHVRDIAGLFALIREAIDDDAHKVEVSYDAVYGYPRFIDIDYIANAIDDELQIRTSDFQLQR